MFRSFFTIAIALLVGACSTMGTTPDSAWEEKLSEKSRDILVKIIWDAKLNEVVEDATDEFRQTAHPGFMRQRLERIFVQTPQSRISVNGYETEAGSDLATVYATSESRAIKLYYRLVYVIEGGEFKLTKFGLAETEIAQRESLYRDFSDPLVVEYGFGAMTR